MTQDGHKFLSWTGNQFELIDLAEGRKSIKVFPVGQLSRLLPKHGIFTKKDTIVVCSTDEAHASVFDVSSGALLQRLPSPLPIAQRVVVSDVLPLLFAIPLIHCAGILKPIRQQR